MQAVGKSLGGVLLACTLASMAFGQVDDQGPVTTKEHLTVLQPFVGEWAADRFDGNGEIVLKHNEHLLACATAAGPAFEGAGLGCGVRAGQGAIP